MEPITGYSTLGQGSDLAFEDRGIHSLKGIDDDWHL